MCTHSIVVADLLNDRVRGWCGWGWTKLVSGGRAVFFLGYLGGGVNTGGSWATAARMSGGPGVCALCSWELRKL